MTGPLETMNWLAAQFRDRADEDPGPNTEAGASEVETARTCFVDMMDALRRDLALITLAGRREQEILSLLGRASATDTVFAVDGSRSSDRTDGEGAGAGAPPQWADAEFEVWWNSDPFFTVHQTRWFHFGPGTPKQHVFWEAEQCLKGIIGDTQAGARTTLAEGGQ